jgi:hypothetical protein
MARENLEVKINVLVAAALSELDHRTAPNAPERPTPVIKAAVDALLGEGAQESDAA